MKNAFAGFLESRKAAVRQILLVAGSLLCLNLLVGVFILRWDVTATGCYSLAEPSEEIAAALQDPITVTAYFSGDLPPQLKQLKERFRSLLIEFRAYAEGNLEYEFVNPNAEAEAERAAQQAGIRPVMVSVRKQDQLSQKQAYLGAVFSYRGKQEVLPFLRPNAPLEYKIASTIKRLTAEEKPVVGVLQGHGEPSLRAMPQLVGQLRKRYEVREVTDIDTSGVPPEVEVLLVLGPSEPLSSQALVALDQYIMRGGRAVFALNRVDPGMRRRRMPFAMIQDTGLDSLLQSYGVAVKANLVRDWQSSTLAVRQQRGIFNFVSQVRYPYFPQITRFAEHPISGGLEQAVFRFVSTVDVSAVDSTDEAVVLASSSALSEAARRPFRLNPVQDWQRSEFSEAHLPVAALVAGTFPSAFADDTLEVARTRSQKTQLVVFGDADFVVNRQRRRMRPLPEGNINLMVNSIDYLADETGLMALRTQRVTSRPLAPVAPTTRTLLKYLNVFFPIALVLGYGFVRYRRNRARRRRWREQGV